MFVNQLFTHLTCAYLKSKSCFIAKFSTYYFHMKTKILTDFQICIRVLLSNSFEFTKWFILVRINSLVLEYDKRF